MAIIKSIAIGNCRKSAGNLTYRQLRGRTIASQKITQNTSKTEPQVRQRNSFGELGRLAQVISHIIEQTFDRSRYGSSRNHFIQRNMQLMEYIRGIPNYDPMTPPIKNLSTYLSDPTSGLKVLLAKGALNVLNSFNWDNQCNLVGAMYLSREYQIGDKVTIYLLYSYQVKGAWFDGTKECSKILTESDISSLAMPGCFNINKQTMPGLEQLTEFQEDVRNARFLICGVVEDRKKRTNSYVTLLPERSYILEIESQTITHIEEMIITFKDKELFAEKIANQALGGYALFNPLSPDEHYTVKGISKDENQHPVGLIFSPPAPLSYLIPLNGTDMGHIPLMKEGTTLALLENVLSPELGF